MKRCRPPPIYDPTNSCLLSLGRVKILSVHQHDYILYERHSVQLRARTEHFDAEWVHEADALDDDSLVRVSAKEADIHTAPSLFATHAIYAFASMVSIHHA